MHHTFDSDCRVQEQTCVATPHAGEEAGQREGFLSGCYVLHSTSKEARYSLRWMELRTPEDRTARVELHFYNHHNGLLMNVEDWSDDVEVAGHVVFFRRAEIRGGNVHACEVKQLTFLAFRSVAEAEAVADLASGAQHGDTVLLDDARRRLQSAS